MRKDGLTCLITSRNEINTLCWVKISVDDVSKYFFLFFFFFRKISFDTLGDNLHEMSKPILWEK